MIEAVEGPLYINECLQSADACGQMHDCPAYPYLSQAQARLRETLDVSLDRLLAADRPELAPEVVATERASDNGHRRRVRTADPAAGGEA